MRITFEEVSLKATRRWVEDGRKRQETRKFFQTINPFNLNASGFMKSREEIYAEISAKRDEWLQETAIAKARGEK